MGVRPWYKRYPGDFIAGTLQMSLEEKGAYSMVLDLIYDRGEPIPDDSQWIARVCGCSTRKWNALRNRLIEIGKLTAKDGVLINARAVRQLETEEKEHENRVKNGRNGAENRWNGEDKTPEKEPETPDNKHLAKPGPSENGWHTRSQKPEAREEGSVVSDETTGAAAPPSDDEKFFEIPDRLRRSPEPHDGKPPDPDKAVFDLGKSVLGKNAGGLVTKLKRHFGGDIGKTYGALVLAQGKSDPSAYVGGILRGDSGDDENYREWEDNYYRTVG